jgi:hypothetical protein
MHSTSKDISINPVEEVNIGDYWLYYTDPSDHNGRKNSVVILFLL